MKAFKEFLASKAKEGGEPLNSNESKAKKEMLSHLSDMMKGHMSNGLKKVTIASDSKEGLEKGLEKAKEILPQVEEASEEMSEEAEEEPSSEDPHENMSAEEIDDMIKMLQEKKAKLA